MTLNTGTIITSSGISPFANNNTYSLLSDVFTRQGTFLFHAMSTVTNNGVAAIVFVYRQNTSTTFAAGTNILAGGGIGGIIISNATTSNYQLAIANNTGSACTFNYSYTILSLLPGGI
jgi:aspartate oxidase